MLTYAERASAYAKLSDLAEKDKEQEVTLSISLVQDLHEQIVDIASSLREIVDIIRHRR